MYDFSKIKFYTFWRESQNRIYLDDMYEPLPNAPNEIYQNLYLKDDAFKAVCLKD